jgi:UPF0042 nucleotide-binding protein
VNDNGPQVVFVAGLSGSGKTTAMAALEDLGFYCVDNLPAQLTGQFVELCATSTPPIEKVALAIDAREKSFLQGIPGVVRKLRDDGMATQVFYLDCTTDVLVNRYKETRRVHPLSPSGSVEEGVEIERELLSEMAQLADLRLDSSELNVHQLRDAVTRAVTGAGRSTTVNLVSFGFRYGLPRAADLVFDVRFLPNPHFEAALRPKTGLDPAVAAFALDNDRARELLGHLGALIAFLLPLYDGEGKAYLTVAVGCTGGHHRSVAVLEALASALREGGREVNVLHRDAEKSS